MPTPTPPSTDAPTDEPAEAPTAPDPRAAVFGSVFVLVGHLARLTDAALSDWGLTTRQWLLLAVLTRGFAGRAASLTEAAAAYGSSRQNVKQIAIGLERRGLLRLSADPGDGRTTRLHPLPAVAALFETPDGIQRGEALLARVFRDLEPDEVAVLHGLLARWTASLATDGSPGPSAASTVLPGPSTASNASTPSTPATRVSRRKDRPA